MALQDKAFVYFKTKYTYDVLTIFCVFAVVTLSLIDVLFLWVCCGCRYKQIVISDVYP